MKTEKTLDASTARWTKEIKPVLKWSKDIHGFSSRLAEKMQKKVRGKVISRGVISRWLNENEENRTEPLAGMGLLLVETAKELHQEITTEWAKGDKENRKK